MPRKTSTRRQGHVLTLAQRREAQQIFLTEFAACGIILRACRKANIARETVLEWRANPEFAAKYDIALEEANDVIRAEIFRRGVEGFDEQHVQGGKKFTVHKYDASLLKLIAQSRMRAEFSDRMDVTTGGKDIVSGEQIGKAMEDPEAQSLADELLQRITAPNDAN